MNNLIKIISTTAMALLFTVNANAGLLSIDLSTDTINVGESVSVTINAQDFDATDMFWFNLNFDSTMLAYDDSTLNSDLLLSDADMGLVSGLTAASESYGMSFDFFDDVFSADGSFVLASFDLIATAEGLTDFAITDFVNLAAFDDYGVVFTGANSINVSAVAVPEPSSVFMMMLAGFALVSTRRQQK